MPSNVYGKDGIDEKLATCQALAREFPDGPTADMIRDMEEEIRLQAPWKVTANALQQSWTELLLTSRVPAGTGRLTMQTAIKRVMQTYGMMVHLTPRQEAEVLEKVSNFLKEKSGDEHVLAVEGLKHLLGHDIKRRRRPASP